MPESKSNTEAIDALLADWQQGDIILASNFPIVRLADLAKPLSDSAREMAAAEADADGLAIVTEDCEGVMLLSQTCDLVKACAEQPFAQVCPLVEVAPDVVTEIQRGRRVRFLWVPGLQGRNLVADLDHAVTVEKAVLARFATSHVQGVTTDEDGRSLSRAIGNKLTRVAFPDSFVAALTRMREHIDAKSRKQGPMGKFLEAVSEIRVRPHPSWDAESVEVEFLFIVDRNPPTADEAAAKVEELIGKFAKSDAYPEARGRAVWLDQLSAATYRESDRLDLDRLSQKKPS